MWIHSATAGFISITQSTYEEGKLQLRARDERTLQRLIEDYRLRDQAAEIVELPKADYRWRILLTPRQAAAIISAEVLAIDYSNFKNTAHRPENDHLQPDLMATWSAGMRHQHKRVDELGGANQDPYRSMAGGSFGQDQEPEPDAGEGTPFFPWDESKDTGTTCPFCQGEGCTICETPGHRSDVGDWHCDHCSSWNQPKQATCSMCGESTRPEPAAEPEPEPDSWTCPLCDIEAADIRCPSCGNDEGGARTAAEQA
tara:strand:- start:10059 stop:10826 length:768 start_codon:yes stop_codon:yes gene_type:complete